MKKIFFVFVTILPFFSYCQNWQWANQAGGNASQSFDFGIVITDGTNCYLYGTFSGAMYLQTDTFFGTNGNSDFFIIKYDNNGTELWAKTFGGTNSTNDFESMTGVYDSFSNSLYFAGIFYGTMQLDTLNLVSNGYSRSFLTKFDLNGNVLWAKKAWSKNTNSSIYEDTQPILSLRSDGTLYMNASVLDTAFFDTLSVVAGGFLAKFNGDGSCISVRHLYNTIPPMQGRVNIKFINSDLIMCGSFKQAFVIDTATLISNGDYDMFISRADSNGNILWIQNYGNGGPDGITDFSIDNYNNLYIGSGFTDSISIDGNSFYNSTTDILLFKLDGNGNYIWGKQTYANGTQAGISSIVSDSNGNCYFTGTFNGSLTLGTFNISTTNQYDMYLTRYDNTGNCLGVIHFGIAGGANVVIDNSGSPVVAGTFANTVTIGSSNLTSNGPFDIYLAKSDAITSIGEEERLINNQLIIYANPNAGKCNITIPDEFQHEKNLSLSIFDSYGKCIQQIPVEMNENKIKLNLQAEPKGIYTVTLSNGIKSYYGKIVFE